jgi:hypothetical protein
MLTAIFYLFFTVSVLLLFVIKLTLLKMKKHRFFKLSTRLLAYITLTSVTRYTCKGYIKTNNKSKSVYLI